MLAPVNVRCCGKGNFVTTLRVRNAASNVGHKKHIFQDQDASSFCLLLLCENKQTNKKIIKQTNKQIKKQTNKITNKQTNK